MMVTVAHPDSGTKLTQGMPQLLEVNFNPDISTVTRFTQGEFACQALRLLYAPSQPVPASFWTLSYNKEGLGILEDID